MPRQAKQSLTFVPTEELVAELRKRFAAVDKAKAELLSLNMHIGIERPVHKKHTSQYAKDRQKLAKSIYHAERRIASGNSKPDDKANVQSWKADLEKLEEKRKQGRI